MRASAAPERSRGSLSLGSRQRREVRITDLERHGAPDEAGLPRPPHDGVSLSTDGRTHDVTVDDIDLEGLLLGDRAGLSIGHDRSGVDARRGFVKSPPARLAEASNQLFERHTGEVTHTIDADSRERGSRLRPDAGDRPNEVAI